jgi:hypothetical protein
MNDIPTSPLRNGRRGSGRASFWRIWQVESCEAQRQVILKESLKGPSPYERAAEIAPTHPHARRMRRMQDSNFREVRRLTTLLLTIKRYAFQVKALE